MTENRIDSRQETSLRDFLDVVFRRKGVILSVVFATTLLVFVLDARRPDSWESTARVLVARGEQSNLLSQQIRTLGWEEDVASVIQMILSEEVFSRARAAFADSAKAHDFPADWKFSGGSVRAAVIGESNVFTISYADVRPGMCQIGCAVATEAFREFYRKHNAPVPVGDHIMDGLSDTRAGLEQWRQARNQFMNEKKFFGSAETSRFLLNKIALLEQKLSSLNGDISSHELRVANLSGLSEKTGTELESELAFSVSQHVLQSGIVSNIKYALQQLNMRKEELTQKYTDKHPDVIAVNAQIADLHRDLKLQVENAHRVEKGTLQEMQVRRAGVLAELDEVRRELDRVPDIERELGEIDARIAGLEAQEKFLMQKSSDVEIASASRPDQDVSILSHAGKPYSKKTRDYVRLALGPLLSIIVGLGIAFFLESMDHSVNSRSQAEEYLNVTVLATIADSASARKRDAGGG
jgi:polysaccharide biosynthesis transport protein